MWLASEEMVALELAKVNALDEPCNDEPLDEYSVRQLLDFFEILERWDQEANSLSATLSPPIAPSVPPHTPDRHSSPD